MTDIPAGSSRPRIPVWRTAYDAYRLGIGAVFSSGAMFRFFVYGSAMTIAVLSVELYFVLGQAADTSSSGPSYLSDLVAGVLSSIILAAVQTPLGIAIQRRILLGDVPEGSYFNYAANPPGRSYLLMSCCIYAIFLAASVAEIPFLVISGVNPFDSDAVAAAMEEDVTLMFGVSTFVLSAYLVASLISAKFSFVFPEIASERQTESPWQSLAETRGTVWRLFLLFVVIFLPLAVLYFAAFSAAGFVYVAQYVGAGGDMSESALEQMMPAMLSSTEFVIAYAATAAGSALSFVVMVAGAARAYQIRVEGAMSGVAEVFS